MTATRCIFALVLAVAALAAAGCGSDEEGKGIPRTTATGLLAQLDGVQRRIDQGSAGACKDILEGSNGPNKQQVQDLIDAMPDDVDSDVKSALQDSFDHLWDLVEQDCEDKADKQETNTTPTQTATETTPTETQTETTPPETETETTPTETTPPSEEELPPGEGNGAAPGTGNGGGVGPSGNEKEKTK